MSDEHEKRLNPPPLQSETPPVVSNHTIEKPSFTVRLLEYQSNPKSVEQITEVEEIQLLIIEAKSHLIIQDSNIEQILPYIRTLRKQKDKVGRQEKDTFEDRIADKSFHDIEGSIEFRRNEIDKRRRVGKTTTELESQMSILGKRRKELEKLRGKNPAEIQQSIKYRRKRLEKINDVNSIEQRKIEVELYELEKRKQKCERHIQRVKEKTKRIRVDRLVVEDRESLEAIIPWRDLIRYPSQPQPTENDEKGMNYWENNAEARQAFIQGLEAGDHLSYDGFINLLRKMHRLACLGSTGKRIYYPKNPHPGEIREGGKIINYTYEIEASKAEEIAQIIGDPYILVGHSTVNLPGITESAQPHNYKFSHTYPRGWKLHHYFREMQQSLVKTMELDTETSTIDDITDSIVTFYQYAVNARPFRQVNNSLFMNMFNSLLEMHGYKGIPHDIHDHVAHRLQPENYKNWMRQKVRETNIENL